MNDAPEKIWAWDFMVSKQNEFMTGGWHNETEDIDSNKETEYTRSDISQAHISELELEVADEIQALRDLVKQQSTFIDAAFEVYSNLDLDVEQVIGAKEPRDEGDPK
jgi:hypothetical protein